MTKTKKGFWNRIGTTGRIFLSCFILILVCKTLGKS